MLVNGVAIEANIYLEMTYRELKDKEMIYYYFLVTGYIKAIEKIDENRYKLRIPIKEIGYISITSKSIFVLCRMIILLCSVKILLIVAQIISLYAFRNNKVYIY